MDIIRTLASELSIGKDQAEAAVKLIDEGNTIPFIARYRKDRTGSLNDEILRKLDERLRYLRNLEEKKEAVLASVKEQGKLTPLLEEKIRNAATLVAVDDLYAPYRPKRRTRAMIAKEKGLEPLARLILEQETDVPLSESAKAYLTEDVATAAEALAGASDILAEEIADNAEFKSAIRKTVFEEGLIESSCKEKEKDEKKVYGDYYEFSEPVHKIPGHRVLALNRGEAEKVLSVKVSIPEERILRPLKRFLVKKNPVTEKVMEAVVEDSFRRLIFPSVSRDIRKELTEKAEEGAIRVFGENLSQLLMASPVEGKTVLGWDPAFRTGCKLCVVDPTGKVLLTKVIYPTEPQSRVEESKKILKDIIRTYHVDLISLGNGTASRESEAVIAELIRELGGTLQYVIVNEAGASVYSASELATEEFPDLDVGGRSAASMARRLQDPLAELVKIDPKAIGVGQYQHDCDEKKLEASLGAVVEDCVNRTGVDLNTASASLLRYVSGITKPIAKSIVSYREENGRFQNRKELLKVPGLGPKAFEQCAGFLRISGGTQPLDFTGVHPESYPAAEKLMESLGYRPSDLTASGLTDIRKKAAGVRDLTGSCGCGPETLKDILSELEKPGRDPRKDMPGPILKSDILSMEDLTKGMELKGTVRNITDFGAFVDIGVHTDGLVHLSQLSDRFIRHPLEAVKVGDIVTVRVLSVDPVRKRISLTMKKNIQKA